MFTANVIMYTLILWGILLLEKLQQLKSEESQSELFVALPSDHFFEVANLLLSK